MPNQGGEGGQCGRRVIHREVQGVREVGRGRATQGLCNHGEVFGFQSEFSDKSIIEGRQENGTQRESGAI